jgi:hypothetical protein
MGKARALGYLEENGRPGLFVGWVGAGGPPRLEWLKEAP